MLDTIPVTQLKYLFVVTLISKDHRVNMMNSFKHITVNRNANDLRNVIMKIINFICNKTNTIIKLESLTSKHSLPILVHRKVAVNVLAEFSYNTATNVKN
jgi:hypothetical protein